MSEAELQLNESEKGYLRLPYSLFKARLYPNGGRKLCRSEILLYGAMYTFSNPKKEQRCNMTYSRFGEKLNLSRGTVARGIAALKAAGKIDQDKSRRSCASYDCVDRPKDKGFIKLDLYLYRTKFIVKGEAEPQYLTDSEINILCFVKTHCANEKGNGEFVGSVRGIARTLNLSPTTVQKSIETLLNAGLIYRTREGLGKNGYKRSEYTVNEKLLRKMQQKDRKASENAVRDNRTEAERSADDRTEFESHYARLRQTAQERVEWFIERLNKDDTYQKAEREIRALDIQIARAETYDLPNLETLKVEQLKRKAERAQRMAELNISEADLIPKWQCGKCKDTGFRKGGQMCDCYPKKGERKP